MPADASHFGEHPIISVKIKFPIMMPSTINLNFLVKINITSHFPFSPMLLDCIRIWVAAHSPRTADNENLLRTILDEPSSEAFQVKHQGTLPLN
jgi:hypothetical protein